MMGFGEGEKGSQCGAEKLREILGALGCSASVTLRRVIIRGAILVKSIG